MTHWITPSPDFRDQFNQSPFGFSHSLENHPLFELGRLATLGEAILTRGNPQNFSHYDATHVEKGSYLPGRQAKERIADSIARIEELGSWVKLTSVQEVDLEYDQLLDEIIADFEELTGIPFRAEMTWRSGTIFIAAPGTFTPYHIDHPANFLLQIRGEKEVNVFDQADRSVLPEEEIERFYVGDDSAARYREENQSKAHVFPLTPGLGVHHPRLAPHWVSHGARPSVALSVSFCLRSLDVQARVYQFNHYLRGLGLRPSPYGRRPMRDKAKILALGLVSTSKPRNYRETIYSGIDRLRAATRHAERLVRRRPGRA